MMRERLASNGTVDDFWKSYYRYSKFDLNTTSQNDKKYRRKPFQLDLQLKSKRKKQQQIQTNSVLPNESFDILTSTTMPTSTALSYTTPFVTIESTTTAGITKSTVELQPNNREQNTTSEINSKAQHINDRMNLNETTTSKINEITSTTTTTTEHSITYNVTADHPKGVQPANRAKARRLSNAIWGKWQKWTKCSRSCGTGVMSQSRHCLSRWVCMALLSVKWKTFSIFGFSLFEIPFSASKLPV